MPIYTIKSPDGRTMQIKGDSPPSLDIVKKSFLADQQTAPQEQPTPTQQPQNTSIMETLSKFAPWSPPQDNLTRQDFKNIGETLPLAGIAIKRPLISAATSGAGRLIEGLADREDLKTALLNAAKAMGTDYGVQKGAGYAGKKLAKPISKVQGAVTGAPAESFEHLIKNPALLKGTSIEKIVEGVRKSIRKQHKRVGNLKKAEGKSLKKSSQSMAFGGKDLADPKFIKKITNKLDEMKGGTARYSEKTKEDIRGMLELIKRDPSNEGHLQVLTLIDKHLAKQGVFKNAIDKVKKSKRLSDTDSLLWDMASNIRGKIKNISKGKSPDIGEIRDISSKKQTAIDAVRDRFAEGKKAQQIFDLSTEKPFNLINKMQRFDDILPPKERFLEKAISLAGTNRMTPKLLPLAGSFGTAAAGSPEIAAILAASTIPRLNRKLIQSSPLFGRVAGKLAAGAVTDNTPDTAYIVNADGTLSKDTVLRQRGGN